MIINLISKQLGTFLAASSFGEQSQLSFSIKTLFQILKTSFYHIKRLRNQKRKEERRKKKKERRKKKEKEVTSNNNEREREKRVRVKLTDKTKQTIGTRINTIRER